MKIKLYIKGKYLLTKSIATKQRTKLTDPFCSNTKFCNCVHICQV